MCLYCLYVSWLSLSSNSGSVEVWKCGNVEICLHCLILSNNSGSVEVWDFCHLKVQRGATGSLPCYSHFSSQHILLPGMI